jgi:hypothetical protein
MVNTTNIRIPKKYEKYIDEVWSEQENGDGYWANLIECCICEDTDCHYVHEWTVKDFLKSLQSISVMDEETYISHFGTDCIESYHNDLELLRKEMIV